LALVLAARGENQDDAANLRFGQLMLLALAYAASIGGMATPVGTPPNLIFAGVYAEQFPDAPELDFGAWMRIGVPVSAAILVLAWGLLTQVLLPLPDGYRLGDRQALRDRLQALGPWRPPERRVAVGFAITCFLWVFRKEIGLPEEVHDSTVAAFMAIVFFLAPSGGQQGEARRLLEWGDAARLPWGLLILFGGGIALSAGFRSSGLTGWLGSELMPLTELPTVLMVAGICLFITALTEMTSNTATTALILPVLAATALATDVDPLLLMIPATLAASCAFMLPVATAPNAIVVGSGEVDQQSMVRVGLVLNLVAVVPITVLVLLLG
ncbi:MAG: SLC13 family permease, partial [Myxococcota bacterium]|nr:SLC13 family permease [Myxococcota bacterium]